MIRSSAAVHRLRIAEVAFGGRGIGRVEDGRVAFIPFVIAGEQVRVEVTRTRKSYLETRVLEVEEPSPHRVEAPCPYYGQCGGCSYQHMAGAEQLVTKRQQVTQALRRIGRVEAPVVEPVVPSPQAYEYRNRITVHVRNGLIGFYGQDPQQLIDIERCPIAEPAVNEALARFRAGPPRLDGNYTLRANPDQRTFRQTNDGAGIEMLAIVDRLVQPQGGNARLIDAYCGEGFFAKRLRAKFARVIGIEWDHLAVERARRSVLPQENYVSGDVGECLAVELADAAEAETWLITDPPSEGLSSEVHRALESHPPAHWIYVSCNPATFARDLAGLRNVFELIDVTPLDMFPQTAEIELIARLRRRR